MNGRIGTAHSMAVFRTEPEFSMHQVAMSWAWLSERGTSITSNGTCGQSVWCLATALISSSLGYSPKRNVQMPNSSPVSSIAARIEPLSRPPESSTTGLLVARLQAAISYPGPLSFQPAVRQPLQARETRSCRYVVASLPTTATTQPAAPMPLNEGRQPRSTWPMTAAAARRPRARPCGSSRGTSRGPRVSWCRQPGLGRLAWNRPEDRRARQNERSRDRPSPG